jgi:hypothetical protein
MNINGFLIFLFYLTFSGMHVTQNGDTCFVTLPPKKQARPNTVSPSLQTHPQWQLAFQFASNVTRMIYSTFEEGCLSHK